MRLARNQLDQGKPSASPGGSGQPTRAAALAGSQCSTSSGFSSSLDCDSGSQPSSTCSTSDSPASSPANSPKLTLEQPGRAAPPPLPQEADSSRSSSPLDYLEVNEFLYLRNRKRLMPLDGDRSERSKATGSGRANENQLRRGFGESAIEISEFSAFTLERDLLLSRNSNNNNNSRRKFQAEAQRPSVRRSATMRAPIKRTARDKQCSPCCCCCCCNNCQLDRKCPDPSCAIVGCQEQVINSSKVVKRSFTMNLYLNTRGVDGVWRSRKFGASAAVRGTTSCGAPVRRPVPVPPPVVPLYKELALLPAEGETLSGEFEELPDKFIKANASSLMDLKPVSRDQAAETENSSTSGKQLRYTNNWRSLGLHKREDEGESPALVCLKSAQSCCSVAEIEDTGSTDCNRPGPIQGRALGQTLSRRTSKLLARFGQSLMSRVLPTTGTATTAPSKNKPPTGSLANKLPIHEPVASDNETRLARPPESPYDMPEALELVWRGQGPKAARRPAIPPPLPPKSLGRAHSDCAVNLASENGNIPQGGPIFNRNQETRARLQEAGLQSSKLLSSEAQSSSKNRWPAAVRNSNLRNNHRAELEAPYSRFTAKKVVKWASGSRLEERERLEGERGEETGENNLLIKLGNVQVGNCGLGKNPATSQVKKSILNNTDGKKRPKFNDIPASGSSKSIESVSKQLDSIEVQPNSINLRRKQGASGGVKLSSFFTKSKENAHKQAMGSNQSIELNETLSSGLNNERLVVGRGLKGGSCKVAKSCSTSSSPHGNSTSNSRIGAGAGSGNKTLVSASKCNGSIKSLSVMINKLMVGESQLPATNSSKQRSGKQSSARNYNNNPTGNSHQNCRELPPVVGRQTLNRSGPAVGACEIEKRRASIRNGDVFIYPSTYTDLNECHKCLRDRLICNCNNNSADSHEKSAECSENFPKPTSNQISGADANLKPQHQIMLTRGSEFARNNLDLGAFLNSEMGDKSGGSEMKSTKSNENIELAAESRNIGHKMFSSNSETATGNQHNSSQAKEENFYDTVEAAEVLEVAPLKWTNHEFEGASAGNAFNCCPAPATSDECDNSVLVKKCVENFEDTKTMSDDQSKQLNGDSRAISSHLQQTLSSRRRHLISSKLIGHKNHPDFSDQLEPEGGPEVAADGACLDANNNLAEGSAEPNGDAGGELATRDAEPGETFEYSPILASVRDYIKNYNSDLQSSPEPSTPGSSISQSCSAASPLIIQIDSASDGQLDETLSKTSRLPPADGEIQAAQLSAVVSDCNAKLTVLSPIGVTSTGSLLDATMAPDSLTSSIITLRAENLVESPKKSIFDGASKDEILEYLEDARERVPEILMAADDVMVINENELIVVNQLEPNLPATPISIVDSTEILQSVGLAGESAGAEAEAEARLAKAEASLEAEEPIGEQPEQLRQHLRQIYKTSRLIECAAELTQSEPESLATSSETARGDEGCCLSEMPSCFGEDSPEASKDNESIQFKPIEPKQVHRQASLELSPNGPLEVPTEDLDSVVGDPKFRGPLEEPILGRQRDSYGNNDNVSSGKPMSSLLDFSQNSNVYAGRRKSSSSGEHSRTKLADRKHTNRSLKATRLEMLGQLGYLNGDCDSLSLSSSPTSMNLSSNTPSSSSNSTSGNCSAVSNYYTSCSLSNSSPLLMMNNGGGQVGVSSIEIGPKDGADQLLPKGAPFFPEVGSLVVVRANKIPIAQSPTIDEAQNENSLPRMEAEEQKEANEKLEVIREKNFKFATSYTPKPEAGHQRLSKQGQQLQEAPTFLSAANLMSRALNGHYATMTRLNHYFLNRHPLDSNSDSTIEFQCLDCDQFIDVDHATMMSKTNEIRLLHYPESGERARVEAESAPVGRKVAAPTAATTAEQLDRAYIAAMNGLPLCKGCEKRRVERKEIIGEFVDTELKYGRDLKILHEEFYRPMQIAGLLSKDQLNGVFLNLEELIMAHCRFADRLGTAISDAHSMGDTDYNTVNIGRLFVESAEMLHTFESYCVRQGSAACLLARLAKEKELLRIFLRVSQMENTLLRRMNLAAFLMVPVQRVTRYPLLLNRLYKVTAYHHKDREALRDAQLKVELHLEHINQQTKGVGASNKIWRRISNLSAPMSHRRGLINAEDIGYIKLRKTAMDMLKWDRDETQFIHSGKLNFTSLNEFLTKTKSKSLRYMTAHALLIVLGKPNWKYRPDLVKSTLDNKLMTPTKAGNGIKEAALLLFREKNGRFVACREPLFLSNCVLSTDCSQFNCDCPMSQPNHHGHHHHHCGAAKQANSSAPSNQVLATATASVAAVTTSTTTTMTTHQASKSLLNRSKGSTQSTLSSDASVTTSIESNSLDSAIGGHFMPTNLEAQGSGARATITRLNGAGKELAGCQNSSPEARNSSSSGADALSMSSLKSLPEEHEVGSPLSPPAHASRSYSLASALPRTAIPLVGGLQPGNGPHRSVNLTCNSNTIFNQIKTKVNNYHNKQAPRRQVEVSVSSKSSPSSSQNQDSTWQQQQQQQSATNDTQSASNNSNGSSPVPATVNGRNSTGLPSGQANNLKLASNGGSQQVANGSNGTTEIYQHYNHYFHNHHQLFGDYEESFEIHERLTKESLLLKADTPLKTRYWLQMLRYHAKDLGQWRSRRCGLANIMMMRSQD